MLFPHKHIKEVCLWKLTVTEVFFFLRVTILNLQRKENWERAAHCYWKTQLCQVCSHCTPCEPAANKLQLAPCTLSWRLKNDGKQMSVWQTHRFAICGQQSIILLYLIIGCNSQILTFISVWLGGPSTLAPVLLKLNIKPQNQRWMYHILLIYSLCSYHCCQCLDIWEMKERLRQVFPF